MARIKAFEIIDHGIEHAQYFQGCGAGTNYDAVYTGCGSNFDEAINECFEQISSEDKYTYNEYTMLKAQGLTTWPTKPDTAKYHAENENSEMYYYVSVRVK